MKEVILKALGLRKLTKIGFVLARENDPSSLVAEAVLQFLLIAQK